MTQVLRHLVPFDDPNVLVGATAGDDAAVYRLDGERALVATVDFFTPIVDDPFDFGRIAAANALSDIYAKGGRPLFALNLIGFPRDQLDEAVVGEIIRGGGVIAREAGIAVVGGHSVDAHEPLYGLCVIGEVTISRLRRNSGARVGDRLVLTKPLGTGVIATALKAGQASAEVTAGAVACMTTLNRGAAEAVATVDAGAATDVTGFGLLGHLSQVLAASGVAARISASAVPLLPGALDLAAAGAIPGGTRRNYEDVAALVEWDPSLSDPMRLLLCDAQTSGGLLITVAAADTAALLARLERAGTPAAAVVGEVVDGPAGTITALP